MLELECCLHYVWSIISLESGYTPSFSLFQRSFCVRRKGENLPRHFKKLNLSVFLSSASSTTCQRYVFSSYRPHSLSINSTLDPPGHSRKHMKEVSRREKLMARCSVCWEHFNPPMNTDMEEMQIKCLRSHNEKPGMLPHVCKTSTWEAETWEGLKFKASLRLPNRNEKSRSWY